MGLDPKVWLPHFQFVMQTMAISYPANPNDVSKKKYYDFIQNLPVFLPDKPMGTYFIKLLDDSSSLSLSSPFPLSLPGPFVGQSRAKCGPPQLTHPFPLSLATPCT